MLRRRARHRNADRAGLAALASAVVLTGCGGDDGATDFPPGVSQPRSKVEFLRDADRICFASESRIEAAADDLLSGRVGPRPAEVERVALGVAVPALEAEARAIGALGAPPGDEAEVAAILSATERGIRQIEADPRALVDGPPPALTRAQRLAESYGSTQCGFAGVATSSGGG